MKRHVLGLLAILCGVVAIAAVAESHHCTVGAIHIDHPWARATPPNATVGAGYMTLKNTGPEDDRLIAAESAAAERVELHSTTEKSGVLTMRQIPAIELPAGRTVALEPGGMHLMLIGLKAPLVEKTRLPATLTFERAGPVEVEFAVQAISGGGDHGDHHHRH